MDMKEIRRTAKAYYENLSDEKKGDVDRFFKKMDRNGDGQINLAEFVGYLWNDNNTVLTDPSLFKALDTDGNGNLDRKEAIVLYYIKKSGRALSCKSCDKFLAGAYFSCSQCFFKDSSSIYGICCDCYGKKKFTDHHSDAIFLDNYTLLLQSRSVVHAAPKKKREMALQILKQGLQLASFTGALECFFNGGAGDDDSNCSIM
ncbi:hypothetical protein POTOM_045902 [Populus tomentosa]|uniref:EF-hand domain-containing protein n=1 Tax=Populus tomentosa TaxID=118781 RepID=A0A8X7YMU1_POPTO|nr:hypothetical protein POTOM_045902 [Populus tomentosa]